MMEHIEDLDQAIEFVLEKATANNRAHIMAATMTQEDHDKHADALGHHASAIKYYREKPEVKELLDQLGGLVKARGYVNKQIKMDQKSAPQISMEDLAHDHPIMQGRDEANKQKVVENLNTVLKNIHSKIHGGPVTTTDPETGKPKESTVPANEDFKKLMGHGRRFLAHLAAMQEWHNLQKKGEGAHHQFAGHLAGPELEDNHANSRFRGHSTPSATDRTKFRTQSITKAGGAKWHPASPEMTSLEEAAGHPSVGKLKELYPFHEIKVNAEPLKMREFTDKKPPEEIHEQDYATNLTQGHKVKTPDGQIVDAMGGYHGSKSANQNMEHMSRVGVFKKSQRSEISTYFPEATVAHVVLAQELIKVLNPYAAMTDEEFGDYVVTAMAKPLGPSEQAAIMVEAENRLEKAAKAKPKQNNYKISDAEHKRGQEDVLAGRVTPLPLTEASERTTKEGEKRDELQDLERMSGSKLKRSPYAVPKEVFTDDTYSKIDPEKYKEYVNGEMNEQDHRNQLATYQQVIRHNPEAQKRHKQYVDLHREQVRSGLGRSMQGEEETPVANHLTSLKEAGEKLKAGKITPQEFAEINARAAAARKQGVGGRTAEAEMSPEEKEIKQQDPSYTPKRQGSQGKAEAASEKDLTSIAHGKIPSHMLADKGDFGADDEHSDAQARDMMGSKGAEGDGVQGGSVTGVPSPIQLINEHPGFKAYLKMREHLLGHYKNPAVRKYMEEKLLQHENNPNLDVGKLAAMHHFLHRSRTQAESAAKGQGKMLSDVLNGEHSPSEENPSETGDAGEVGKGNAMAPETMMTPEQTARLNEARQAKAATPEAPTPPPADPNRTAGLRTADPEYKKKLMAEMQARENAKKPK